MLSSTKFRKNKSCRYATKAQKRETAGSIHGGRNPTIFLWVFAEPPSAPLLPSYPHFLFQQSG